MILDIYECSEDADEHASCRQHYNDPYVDGSIRPDVAFATCAVFDSG